MPTWKQTQAAKNLVENGGNAYKAMRDAGYSHATAKTAKKLTQSKGIQSLLASFVSNDELVKELGKLLHSRHLARYTFPSFMEDKEIKEIIEGLDEHMLQHVQKKKKTKVAYYWKPDNTTRAQAIDMIIKINGGYAPKKAIVVENSYKDLSSEELNKKIAELENPGRNYKD